MNLILNQVTYENFLHDFCEAFCNLEHPESLHLEIVFKNYFDGAKIGFHFLLNETIADDTVNITASEIFQVLTDNEELLKPHMTEVFSVYVEYR